MQLQKPYDGQALIKELEKQGIVGGIEAAKKCVSVLADFLRSSAQMSTEGLIGKLDDFIVPGINFFEKEVNDKLSDIEAKLSAPAAVELESAPVAAAPAEPAAPSEPAAPQS